MAALALIAWIAFGFVAAQTACAHDPRFACSPRGESNPVRIPDPGKSWAYYGHLAGNGEDVFAFTISHKMSVPWNLLVDVRDAANRARPQAVLTGEGGKAISRIDLVRSRNFYEPFSRMTYLESPDAELALSPGTYRIRVTLARGPGPQRYVLAIGEAERFGPREIPYVFGAIHRIRSLNY